MCLGYNAKEFDFWAMCMKFELLEEINFLNKFLYFDGLIFTVMYRGYFREKIVCLKIHVKK